MPLISAEKPLPPRGDMQDCFTPDSRLSRISGTLLGFGAAVVVWVDDDGLLPSTTICLVRQAG
jgi:hypothetical protein